MDRNCVVVTFWVRGGTSWFYFPPREALGRAVLASIPTGKPQRQPWARWSKDCALAVRLSPDSISSALGPFLLVEAATARVVKLQRGSCGSDGDSCQSIECTSWTQVWTSATCWAATQKHPLTSLGKTEARRNTKNDQVKGLIRR